MSVALLFADSRKGNLRSRRSKMAAMPAAADAHSHQGVASAGAMQFVDRLDSHDGAGCADRVAKRDAAAVGIDLGGIEAEFLGDRAGLCSKASLASMTSICSSFRPARCNASRGAGTGPIPMILGSTPACAWATRASQRLGATGFEGFAAHQQDSGRAVVDT